MKVYRANKLVSLDVPKTGSTSLTRALGNNDSYTLGESHITPLMLKKQLPKEFHKLESFHKVTFVREPLGRFSSSVGQYLTQFDPSFVVSKNIGLGVVLRGGVQRSCTHLLFEILERMREKEEMNTGSDLQHFRLQSEYLRPSKWSETTKLIEMGNFSLLRDYLIHEIGLSEGMIADPGVVNKGSSRPPNLGLANKSKTLNRLHKLIPERYRSWYAKPFNLMHEKTMAIINEEIRKEPFMRAWTKVFEEDIELWKKFSR